MKKIEFEEVYHEYEKIIKNIAGRYSKKSFLQAHGLTFDDLIQSGRIGLMNAYRDYDNTIGTFKPFALKHIRWSIINEIKSESLRREQGDWSFSFKEIDSIYFEDENGEELVNKLQAECEQPYDEALYENHLENIKNSVSPRTFEIMKMRIADVSVDEISKKIGVSKRRVYYLLNKEKEKVYSLLSV